MDGGVGALGMFLQEELGAAGRIKLGGHVDQQASPVVQLANAVPVRVPQDLHGLRQLEDTWNPHHRMLRQHNIGQVSE